MPRFDISDRFPIDRFDELSPEEAKQFSPFVADETVFAPALGAEGFALRPFDALGPAPVRAQLACPCCGGSLHKLDYASPDGPDGPVVLRDLLGSTVLQNQAGPTGDTIPGNVTTTFTLAIGGTQTGFVNVPGDDDWFRVELVAGQSYVFTSTGFGGAGGQILEDPYLELYSASGQLLAIDDDAGPGRDAMLRFTALQSGTYYINARAWEPDTGPELTGGYQISANLGPPQNPLDTIDLGFATPLHIDVYFATAGQILGPATAARSWTQSEINSALAALDTFADATNLTFSRTFSSVGAEFVLFIADLDTNILGQATRTGGVSYLEFEDDLPWWTAQTLQPGGIGWVTLIHEIGHGLGLAHPHDNSGDSEIMQGVIDQFDSYGAFLMNQGVFTTMTYNQGWPTVFGAGTSFNFGNQATPMALDVALLQQRYGADMSANLGDTTYTLPSVNAAGTSFSIIWDAGGVDTIQAGAALATTIDLRPATLLNEIGGGGFVSWHASIRGGFAIAAGAVIENASGGAGDDQLIGNAAANVLNGGNGNDGLVGGGGDDALVGGAGTDAIDGGAGIDRAWYADAPGAVTISLALSGSPQNTGAAGVDTLVSIEVVFGSNFADTLVGASGDDTLIGLDGSDTIQGGGGGDWLVGGNGDDWFIQGAGGGSVDRLFGDAGTDTLDFQPAGGAVIVQLSGYTTTSGGTLLATFTGIENAFGSAFDDALIGSGAGNRLAGGGGSDWIVGGGGDDIFVQRVQDSGVDRLFGGTPGADSGVDEINYSASGVGLGVIIQLSGYATTLGGTTLATFSGIENAFGTEFNDSLIGNAANNHITGFWGADWLVGGDGDDTFVLYGDGNADRIFGGTSGGPDTGFDTIQAAAANTAGNVGVIVQLSGYATTNDAAHTLLVTFTGIEGAVGTGLNDALIGNASGNALEGGFGADWLVGGLGADDFIYQIPESTLDTIADFSHAQGDIIDLGALDANLVTPGDQDFVFSLIRTPGLAGEAVAVATSATTALVSLYMNADNIADMTIAIIHDGVALGQDDFVL